MYVGTLVHMTAEKQDHPLVEIERVQTGVRLEKRMLKVLKAIAEQKDITLGDLLEGEAIRWRKLVQQRQRLQLTEGQIVLGDLAHEGTVAVSGRVPKKTRQLTGQLTGLGPGGTFGRGTYLH